MTLLQQKKKKKLNDRLYKELKEWQDVMFDAGVPEQMLEFININLDNYLSNKALMLLNKLLIKTTEEN